MITLIAVQNMQQISTNTLHKKLQPIFNVINDNRNIKWLSLTNILSNIFKFSIVWPGIMISIVFLILNILTDRDYKPDPIHIKVAMTTLIIMAILLLFISFIQDNINYYTQRLEQNLFNRLIFKYMSAISYGDMAEVYYCGYVNLLHMFKSIIKTSILKNKFEIDIMLTRGIITLLMPIYIIISIALLYTILKINIGNRGDVRIFGGYGISLDKNIFTYIFHQFILKFGPLSFQQLLSIVFLLFLHILCANGIISLVFYIFNKNSISSVAAIYSCNINNINEMNPLLYKCLRAIYYSLIFLPIILSCSALDYAKLIFNGLIINSTNKETYITYLPSTAIRGTKSNNVPMLYKAYCDCELLLHMIIKRDIKQNNIDALWDYHYKNTNNLTQKQIQQIATTDLEMKKNLLLYTIHNIKMSDQMPLIQGQNIFVGWNIILLHPITFTNMVILILLNLTIILTIMLLCYKYGIEINLEESHMLIINSISSSLYTKTLLSLLIEGLSYISAKKEIKNTQYIDSIHGINVTFDKLRYNVTKYNNEQGFYKHPYLVLQSSHFKLPAKSINILSGASGGGKTTLVNYILQLNSESMLDKNDTSIIKLLTPYYQIDAKNIDSKTFLKNVCYLPQNFNGINGNLTLMEVMAYLHLSPANIFIMTRLLDIFEMSHIPLSRQYYTLSGGQRKRFESALIITSNIDNKCGLLVIDELLGLDVNKRELLFGVLKNIHLMYSSLIQKRLARLNTNNLDDIIQHDMAYYEPTILLMILHTSFKNDTQNSVTQKLVISDRKTVDRYRSWMEEQEPQSAKSKSQRLTLLNTNIYTQASSL